MPKPVKRDQARTRFARRAVVEAARALFLERGYSATTIEAISERSDVPPATVYRLFSSKLGILKSLVDTSIAGDAQHEEALKAMKSRWRHPKASMGWYKGVKTTFASLAEE